LLVGPNSPVGGHHANGGQEWPGCLVIQQVRLDTVVRHVQLDLFVTMRLAMEDGAPIFAKLNANCLFGRCGLDTFERHRQKFSQLGLSVPAAVIPGERLLAVEKRKLQVALFFEQDRPNGDALPGRLARVAGTLEHCLDKVSGVQDGIAY